MSEIHVPTCPQCGAVMEIIASCRHGLMPKLKLPPCPNCAAKDEEIERLKDALDRQAAHYGGALSIEKARAEKAERERDEAQRYAASLNCRFKADNYPSAPCPSYAPCQRCQRDAAEARAERLRIAADAPKEEK